MDILALLVLLFQVMFGWCDTPARDCTDADRSSQRSPATHVVALR